MAVPDVPWLGRDTAALSHEMIHRWVHDGADPAALDSARARHAARGEELRAAAERLERAHTELGASWRGRDADAASTHIRSLVARMSRLGDAVTGQAGSLQGVRDALARVQSAVGPPRPPALPVLGAAPRGLPAALAAGGPADGFGAFQAAQAEERAAQNAYRAYLEQAGVAARSAPSAVDGAAGRAPVGGAVEAPPVRAGSPGRPGARPARREPRRGPPRVLLPVCRRFLGPSRGPGPRGRRRLPDPPPDPALPAAPTRAGGAARRVAGRRPGGTRSCPRRASRDPLGAVPPAHAPAPGGAAPARPGPVGRIVSRLLGGPSVPPGPPPGAGSTVRGGGGALPGSAPGTAADRLLGGPAPPPRAARAAGDDGRPREERAPARPARPGSVGRATVGRAPVGRAPGSRTPRSATGRSRRAPPPRPRWAARDPVRSPGLLRRFPDQRPRAAGPDTAPGPDAGHTSGGPGPGGVGPPLLPPPTGAGAEASRAVHRHPEYLVDADPWAAHTDDPAQRRLVTPPVLGEDVR